MQAASVISSSSSTQRRPGLHPGSHSDNGQVTAGQKETELQLADASDPSPTAAWRGLKREPLLQFLLLGALIFVVAHLIERARGTEQRQILIDDELQRRIVQLQTTQTGVTPGPQQLAALVQNYVDDEVLYREARRLGLDQDDEIVRRRLIQKLEFLQRDLTAVPEPTDAQLRAYYDAHREAFALPARVSFTHIYFSPDFSPDLSPDRSDADNAQQRAEAARRALAAGADAAQLAQLGDAFPLQSEFAGLTRVEAIQLFGATPIVDALFNSPPEQWSVPVRSGYGWHLVRIDARNSSSVPRYATVRTQVRDAYLQDAAAAANRHQLETLRARYEILRPGSEN